MTTPQISLPRPADPAKLLLKPEEAAAVLGIGRTTLFALVKEKRLAAVKIGNLRRFRRSDLQSFVDHL